MPNAILGMKGSGEWGTEELETDYFKSVIRRFPNLTPALAVLSQLGGRKQSVKTPEYKLFTQEEVPGHIRINAVAGYAADNAVVTMVVKNEAGGQGNTYLRAGDRVQVTRTGEIMQVDQNPDPTNNNLHFIRGGNLGSVTAALVDSDVLTILSAAHSEGSGRPQSVSWNPDLGSNFTQITKEAWDLTGTASAVALRHGEDPLAKTKKDAFEAFWKKRERDFFFNVKNSRTGANGKPERTSGGLYHFMPAANVVDVSGNVTEDVFIGWAENWFKNTDASEVALFGGATSVRFINQAMAKKVTFMGDSSSKAYGIKFATWQVPFGQVHLNVHPLFKRNPELANDFVVVNFEDLGLRFLEGRDLTYKDLKLEDIGTDEKAGQWIAEMGYWVPFGNKHFWYKNITGYA